MTTTENSSRDDAPSTERETRSAERERIIETLTEALETEDVDEKDYQIREALQLLSLKDE